MRIKHLYLLKIVAFLFVLFFGLLVLFFFTNKWHKKEKMNVILISIDSLRKDHMSTYGYQRKTTQNIDKFAKKSFVFDNFFSTGYLTPISEASVHTGYYPQGNRVINFSSGIDSHTPTIAELLRVQGYRTAAFGGSPEFNENRLLGASFRRGFEKYKINENLHHSFPDINEISDWIGTSGDSFFLWIPIGAVHFPYNIAKDHFVNPRYEGVLKEDLLWYETVGYIFKKNIYANNSSTLAPFARDKNLKKIALGDEDMQYVIDKYDDGIYNVDQYLGKMFSFFEKKGLLKNSIIIIQSEHGEDLGEHDHVMHYDIFDTTIHTPLIIFYPKKIGTFNKESIVSGVDLVPTILDLLNIKPIKTDGVSFAQLLTNSNRKNVRTEVFASRTPLWERVRSVSDYKNEEFIALDNTNHFQDYAIRNTTWKLIHRTARKAEEKYSWYTYISGEKITREEYELYDIQKDPFEKNNVYNKNMDREEVINLKKKLVNFEKDALERLKDINSQIKVEPYFR